MKLTVLLQFRFFKQNMIKFRVLLQSSSNKVRLQPRAETMELCALGGKCQILLRAVRQVVHIRLTHGCDKSHVTEP